MILLCVGLSEFDFSRPFKIVDELLDEKFITDEVIEQVGRTVYCIGKFQSFSMIGRDDFQKYLTTADIVISHAATGSVVFALKKRKKVIVFPGQENIRNILIITNWSWRMSLLQQDTLYALKIRMN